MKLVTVFEYDELNRLQSGVVVEGWRSVMSTGSGKRKFAAEFTEEEQDQCRHLWKIFTKWYSGVGGTGVPQKHAMSLETYELAKRLCNFFGMYGRSTSTDFI